MVIEFAIDHYDRLLAACDPSSREYDILKNGLVVRRVKNGKYERVVEIFAEMREAQLLLDHAQKICPAAAPAITKAMSLASGVCVNLPFKSSDQPMHRPRINIEHFATPFKTSGIVTR